MSARDQARAVVRWRPLSATETATGLTTPIRTVVDCLCDEPEDVGLSVADSALRDGAVSDDERPSMRRPPSQGSSEDR